MVPIVLAALGLYSAAMVTAAPVVNSNEETLVNLGRPDAAVDRAKRADEEIFYGNEQNKQRMVAKKSGPYPIVAPSQPELDEGSEVIVHKEQPVTEELKDRLEAAAGDNSEKDEEYANELESSMHSIVNSVLGEESEEEATSQVSDSEEQGETTEDDSQQQEAEVEDEKAADTDGVQEETIAEVVPSEDQELIETEAPSEDVEETAFPGVSGEPEALVEAPVADDAEKDLQVVGLGSEAAETGEDEGTNQLAQEPDDVNADLDPSGADAQETYSDLEGYTEPPSMLYNYLNVYPGYPRVISEYQQANMDPYFLARRRRSLAKARRNRRIKRDLLDDGIYNMYDSAPPEPYYPPVAVNEDDNIALTDNEASLLFSSLLDYIEEALADEEMEEALQENERYASEESVDDGGEAGMPFEPEYLPAEGDQFQEPAEYLPQGGAPYALPYDNAYPYGPVDLDTYGENAKRGRELYYPGQESKRSSFFPYADEPDTHWGAFIPEKRDYSEAIQRLQRLAMALSDNSAPYYQEMLDEYRRKK